MDYLPIFCQLQQKACLLVGGGEVAERKARLLMDAGADIMVNAKEFTPQFDLWAQDGKLKQAHGEFSPALLEGIWLVIAATDDENVNDLVYQQA
ncbi:MAG: siroheme synthase CysG, partial [Hafniaceae bacterium]|nr:siroheme synthase CysG [Hafniaceae bacterium]